MSVEGLIVVDGLCVDVKGVIVVNYIDVEGLIVVDSLA